MVYLCIDSRIDVAGTGIIRGWATINYDITDHSATLCLLLNLEGKTNIQQIPLKKKSIQETIKENIEQFIHTDKTQYGVLLNNDAIQKYFILRKTTDLEKLITILLYICSDEPEIDSERQPGTYPARLNPVKTKTRFRLFPVTGVHYWIVGEKTGRTLTEALMYSQSETTTTGRHPCSHLRRSHWHGFWSGKMDEPYARKFTYRWLPPQIIGGRPC